MPTKSKKGGVYNKEQRCKMSFYDLREKIRNPSLSVNKFSPLGQHYDATNGTMTQKALDLLKVARLQRIVKYVTFFFSLTFIQLVFVIYFRCEIENISVCKVDSKSLVL